MAAMDWQSSEPDIQSTPNVESEGSSKCEEANIQTDLKDDGRPVNISYCGCTPLLWKVSDIKKCREDVGVIGTLVGSLARQPRQNGRLGRPLEILQEEARLLVETGKAVATQHSQVSESDDSHSKAVELYQARLEQSYKEQCALALEDKKEILQKVLHEKQNDHNEEQTRAVKERLASFEKSFTFPRSAVVVQLCTARAGLSHFSEERDFLAADLPMPRSALSETRFLVYRDLRKKGFYLTSAGKFGGDYLVYPGDPLRFHAHFIALCLPMDEQSSLYDILAIARLGSNVKKTVLLCSPQDSSDTGEEVVYSSLQWSGMV